MSFRKLGIMVGSALFSLVRRGLKTVWIGSSGAVAPCGRLSQCLATFNRPRGKAVLRVLSARALGVVILLTTIGLAHSRQACADEYLSVRPNGSIYTYSHTYIVILASLTDAQISSRCARYYTDSSWITCYTHYHNLRIDAKEYLKGGLAGFHSQAPSSRLSGRSRAKAGDRPTPGLGSTFTPSLDSSTPGLPFLGNQLTVLSWVPNSTTAADATAAYATGLSRQSDCSLDEDYVLPGAGLPDAEYLTSLPDAQDYFHQLAGLTTKPDVFANGCDDQVLGLPTTDIALSLGATADGAAIGAELTFSGNLVASVTDLTANTVTTTTLTGGENGLSFSAASLRSNGIMDVVEVFQTDPATQKLATAVFVGNGDGTFKPPVYYDVAGSLTIDDVNGDGIPDIVVAGTGIVTTLIGKGDGTFTIGPVSTFTSSGSGGGIEGVATGDFNGDGKKDLLVDTTVLFGGGDGTFTQGPTSAALANVSTFGTGAVGDLRNNGKLDVVVSERGSVAIFYGNGDGTFAVGPRYAGPPDGEQVTITDIDGDGNLDIVVGTSTGGVYTEGGYDTPLPMYQILMGRGDGTFVDSLVYSQGTYNVNGSVGQIASADFTGDGKLDVLVLEPNNSGTTAPSLLAVLPGDGKGNLGAPITSPINFVPVMVAAADLNGASKPNVVVAGYSKLALLINQGNGTFAGEQDYTLPDSPVSLAVGDFNGDGFLDVAVGVTSGGGTGTSGVYVLFGQANGTLGSPVQIDTSLSPSGLAAGSLTTDGRTDLVVADQGFFDYGGSQQVNGALHVYLGNKDGTFTTAATPSTTATNYTVAALGDLNHDGKLDLIVAGNVTGTSPGVSTPNVYTLLGNGDGTFQTALALPLASADGIGAGSIALADFNHDGNLDVVVGNDLDYTEVLLGNGDGTLDDTILALGQQPGTVAAADLLGNGFPELLVGQTVVGGSNLIVFLNSTAGWKAPPGPVVSLSATSLTFGTVTVGQASGSDYVTLTNTGSTTLSISSISVTGTDASSFVFANSCGTSLAPGAECSIHGHFAPTGGGALTASISITSSADSSPDTIALSGMGVEPPVTLSATKLSFAATTVGLTSASDSVTLTNTGTATLTFTSIAVSGTNATEFVFANSCGTTLAAGANCLIHGHFAPTATGAATATVTISDTASGSPQTIALSGTGLKPPVTFSATSLSFGSVNVGSSSGSQTVVMTNSGSAAVTITGIAITGSNSTSFVFANNCGTSLAAGAECTIHGHFEPMKPGALTAAITVTDSAVTSPQTIALSGTGTAPTAPVTLSASSLSYGTEAVGSSSGSQSVTVTNKGTAALTINSIAVTGAEASSFVFANNCGTGLAVGASCTIHGHFAPVTIGALTAAVTITDSAAGSPQSIALSGTGQ